MKCIAIIPARGGSKRLPRKNILPLHGEPLLSRVVKTCIKAGCFDEVVVSTEDAEIASIAENAGARVHCRPESIAGDRSTVVDVCLDVLNSVEAEVFCCVYATSALLHHDTLLESFKKLVKTKDINVLMGVSEYQHSPFQALLVEDSGRVELLHPEYHGVQSQFYPKVRVSNGTFYWARRATFLEEETFYSKKLGVYDVPDSEVCDLDTQDDFDRLLRLYDEGKCFESRLSN